jgi:hypothetical protein
VDEDAVEIIAAVVVEMVSLEVGEVVVTFEAVEEVTEISEVIEEEEEGMMVEIEEEVDSEVAIEEVVAFAVETEEAEVVAEVVSKDLKSLGMFHRDYRLTTR